MIFNNVDTLKWELIRLAVLLVYNSVIIYQGAAFSSCCSHICMELKFSSNLCLIALTILNFSFPSINLN